MDQYVTLPDIYITGGMTEEISFNMLSGSSSQIDLSEFDINFTIAYYTFLVNHPIISYSSSDQNSNITTDGNCISVSISPSDTNNLGGKYLYQITIKDGLDNYVSYQGGMFIKRNINPEFVSNEV